MVGEVFIFWSKSHNFKREEQNFVVMNEINNMSFLTADSKSKMSMGGDSEGGGSDTERTKKKRRGDRYSVQTSLIVAALKKMLPIGLNMCSPADQELINLAKIRYSLRDTDEEVREFLQNNLHLQGKVDNPSMRWQMALYKVMAGKAEDADAPMKVVKRVQEVSAVLYHLEVTEHPFKSKKMVWHKLLSKQRRRAVVACFRMTPLYNIPRHRASNMFLEGYKRNWLHSEGYSFEDRMIDDLSKAMKQEEGDEEEERETKPDPLHQLILHFSRTALTEKSKLDTDHLYMAYADIMAKSCHIGEEEEGGEEVVENAEDELPFEVRQTELVMGGEGGKGPGTQRSDRIVILESPASTLFEGESVTLRCRHRAQREGNAAFYRDGSLITTDRNHQSPLMAKNTVLVMSDRSSYSCTFGDEESEPIKLRPERPSSAFGWRYFWYKKEKTSEPLKRQDVFLTNDRISVSRGGVYWCRGGRGDPVYYTEYSDAVVTNSAVVTLQPNWPQIYSRETVTLTCEIEDGGDYEWEFFWTKPGSETPQKSHLAPSSGSGKYQCVGRLKDKPLPVLTVSPSWPSPGASVTLNCRVDHPSAGWSFYWYKAVPQKSGYRYSYELLTGNENGTEQHLFIIDGQTHTAGYVCRAGRGDPVFYTSYSKPVFVWSGDLNSAASLTVSPDSVQHFTKTSVSLSCEGNSTEWRVRMFSKSDNLYPCSSWGTMTGSTCKITRSWLSGVFWCESETGQSSNAVNITIEYDDIILVSPVRPVAEGLPVTLSCKLKTQTFYNVDFYKNDKLIQNDTRSELTISAVSKSDEGFYKCKQRDSADGRTSAESWVLVKYNACLYETITGPGEPANGESTDVTYSVVELNKNSKKGKKNEPEDCVYSHVQMASAAAGLMKYYSL
ncbi:Ryanodine receptor 1 [Dissostichus eleginoides]|uniref:Ryanodine receptor 1 n=1 Tax=Dissostichus eleginoides TaxID=100907 RepID=A0AAD9BHZ5_DISEL|nr:Ryanodine receptor 1 [Dissostichus eleginoides]